MLWICPARQVDHAAVAEDKLHLGAARSPVLIRNQVSMSQCPARLQPELGAGHDRAQEGHLVALRECRIAAHLCQRNAREPVGSDVPGQGERHLLLDFWIV
jgi:hypothetical protein